MDNNNSSRLGNVPCSLANFVNFQVSFKFREFQFRLVNVCGNFEIIAPLCVCVCVEDCYVEREFEIVCFFSCHVVTSP
jgi:hypothetical protein